MTNSSVIRQIIPLTLFATSLCACASVDRPARGATERPSLPVCSIPPTGNGGYRDVRVRLPSQAPVRAAQFADVERSYHDSTWRKGHAQQGSHGVASEPSASPSRYAFRGTPGCG